MESLLFGLFLLLSVHVTAVKEHHRRQARSILDLVGMLRCSTDRSISYLVYGCYCGIGGRGWPRDGTDWCCFTHDCCYAEAEKNGCHPKSDSYDWSCIYGSPRCEKPQRQGLIHPICLVPQEEEQREQLRRTLFPQLLINEWQQQTEQKCEDGPNDNSQEWPYRRRALAHHHILRTRTNHLQMSERQCQRHLRM
ncbi:group 10 secretory phospholipase A2-like [Heterodontus francisci]|uniref:group 10 secretory phospholipase A2-like n=1 Tax=Heterodontus francisci TaxID=7792 RepID=UPI00355B9148